MELVDGETRDLKPANIMVTPDGNVKVLDFGLAKEIRSAGNLQPRELPDVYMSPEQARGKSVDKRAETSRRLHSWRYTARNIPRRLAHLGKA